MADLNPIATTLARNGRVTLNLGQAYARGVDASRFARLATPGGEMVESNHPCFVFGHLAFYCGHVCRMVGEEEAAQDGAVPETWEALFGMGATCRDDEDGAIYPPMEEVMQRFSTGFERACMAVEQAGDEPLLAALPEGHGFRKRFGFTKLAEGVNFMLTVHPQMHLGQVSAWRRMEGLPSALQF